jgi:hypothetical protein
VRVSVKIMVRVSGLNNLDDQDRLRADLMAQTGLAWAPESPAEDQEPVLGGSFVEQVLTTVLIEKAGEMALGYTVDKVKEVLRNLTSQYLDPPETAVETEPVSDLEPDEG